MPDPLFQTLFNETEAITWAPTGQIRDRARRRVMRTRAAAAVAAVVAVAAISGGVAAAQLRQAVDPQPRISPPAAWPTPAPLPTDPSSPTATASPSSPVPTPPSTSTSTVIVDALFLQPNDVGSGYRAVAGGEGSGDWTFEFVASVPMLGCPWLGMPPESVARRERALSRGSPQDEDFLTQYVALYRPGDAARYLDQIRARVNACRPDSGKSIDIVAQRFAGQDALLIQVDFGDGFTAKNVLVRQGDLLTEFWTKPERSSAVTQELARKAALRLCAGTPVC